MRLIAGLLCGVGRHDPLILVGIALALRARVRGRQLGLGLSRIPNQSAHRLARSISQTMPRSFYRTAGNARFVSDLRRSGSRPQARTRRRGGRQHCERFDRNCESGMSSLEQVASQAPRGASSGRHEQSRLALCPTPPLQTGPLGSGAVGRAPLDSCVRAWATLRRRERINPFASGRANPNAFFCHGKSSPASLRHSGLSIAGTRNRR